MKKYIFLIMCSSWLSISIFGQQIDNQQPVTTKAHIKKRTGFIIAGTVCVVTGAVMESMALATSLRDAAAQADYELKRIWDPTVPPPPSHKKTSNALFLTGAVVIIGSIPLYVSAAAVKRKSKGLSIWVKPEKYLQPEFQSLSSRMMPALSVKIGI